jgi:hypothetical protein
MAQFPEPHLWKYSASCVDVVDIKTSKEYQLKLSQYNNFSTPAKIAWANVSTVLIVYSFV